MVRQGCRKFIPESTMGALSAQVSKCDDFGTLSMRRRKTTYPVPPSTYLLSVLAQLYLGGEQGEGAGRFPPGRLTGRHLEGGRMMDRHTEKESKSGNREEEEGRGGGFRDGREEDRMEAGVVCL